MKQHTVGIDPKAHLDAHRLADGHSAQFDNDPAGFRALIDWIGTPVECIAYEATPCPQTHPGFAEATGSRAKTDAVAREGLEPRRISRRRR